MVEGMKKEKVELIIAPSNLNSLTETNGNGIEKTVEATKNDRPMDRFAPWTIGRRIEDVAA